jgi:membrane protease YdiL (CAAX protease family)
VPVFGAAFLSAGADCAKRKVMIPMAQRRWRPQLTRQEQVRGLIFFGLYFLVFPALKMVVEWALDRFFGLYLSEAMSAAVYYYIMGALTLAVFWSFLKNAWDILVRFVPENLFAFGTGLLGALILGFFVRLLPTPVENPEPVTWAEQFAYSPAATVTIVVVLMPLIDEVLFRGLVFGTLRRHSRPLAWAASVVLFLLYSVWTYAVAGQDARYLLLFVQYLPMALALTWCYDRGGSIWSAAALHAVLDAVALIQAVH